MTNNRGYYIGIDGGATKTIVCLADGSGNIIETLKLGSSNYHAMGIENTKKVFRVAFDSINKNHNIMLEEIASICFGGAGVDSQEGKNIIENIFRDLGYKNKLKIYNDSVVALVGANNGYHGGVIIGGTGSVALGVDDDGRLHKVGGWGHILDDGGSGYAIGRDILSNTMKSYDGRKKDTMLWLEIKKHLNIKRQEEITDFVYNIDTKKSDIAKLAPIAVDLYEKDEVATQIVNKAIDELTRLVTALAENIKKDQFSLALYGSVIIKNEIIKMRLIENIKERYPKVDIHLPYKEAHIGALDIALGKIEIN